MHLYNGSLRKRKNGRENKQESDRLIRWAMYLSGFEFKISFSKGDSPQMRMVDWLSRANYSDQYDSLREASGNLTNNQLKMLQDNCPDCSADQDEKISKNTV